VLLTALALAIADQRRRTRAGHDESVLVDLEGHGRESLDDDLDLSRTVGWFTSVHPVRLAPGVEDWAGLWRGGPPLASALKQIKEQLLAVPDNGIGYGLLRYLNPTTAPALADLPRPQLAFNYLGRFPMAVQEASWSTAPEAPPLGGSAGAANMPVTHSLTVDALTEDHPDGPRLVATWSWPAGLIAEQAVRDLSATWHRALVALADLASDPHAGGLTPSDLPLVSLSQAEVDLLAADLGGSIQT